MTDYETVPYIGYPIPAMHPRRLAWTARVKGGPRPELEHARVLEIGCGDGANLLSVLAFEPGWSGLGIDASPHALGLARTGALRGGITRATFAVMDIATAEVEPEAWDFVLAHGVYSWIDPDRRAALRRLVRRALAPTGLAAISFNALPGWGVRGRIRDILLRAGDHDPMELLTRLRALTSADHPWARMLSHELDLARGARPDYLAHEYLEEHNEAFWVGDVARPAMADGLAWVGDSQFDLAAGRSGEMARELLGVDGLRGEELADLVTYCQLRSLVFCRDDAPRPPAATDAELLDEAFVSGVVTPTTEEFDVRAGVESVMRSAEGMDILVTEPLCKMALDELARIHPDALTAAELAERARERLGLLGVHPASAEETALRDGILRLWRAGALELRLHRPRVRTAAPSPATVSAFTRWEAEMRPAVSTPIGTFLQLEDEQRASIRALDGSGEAPTGLVELLAAWGLVADTTPRPGG